MKYQITIETSNIKELFKELGSMQADIISFEEVKECKCQKGDMVEAETVASETSTPVAEKSDDEIFE